MLCAIESQWEAFQSSSYCCREQARQTGICRNQIRCTLCGWIRFYPSNKIAYGGIFVLILLAY